MTKEEWGRWKQDEVTKEVWEVLRQLRNQCLEEWANGNFQDPNTNLKAIGKVQMLDDILGMTFEEAHGN